MTIAEKIMTLTKQLLPTGRAWRMPIGGWFEKLMKGLQASESRAYEDGVAIFDSALPDNDNFTSDDATAWERRLGIVSNKLVALPDRKLAITRKIAHPGLIPARQNYLYLQGQLQQAGFDVYVYENRFPDYYAGFVTKTPNEFSLLPFQLSKLRHGQARHGERNHGVIINNKVVNFVDETLDYTFNNGPTFRSSFFIGGATPGTWAIVDAARKDELRELVLRLKPRQMVAYLLITFY